MIVSLVVTTICAETRAAGNSTVIGIMPPVQIVTSVGETFTENVNISTYDQISSVKFTISYNAALLGVVTINQGSFFLQESISTYFKSQQNSTAGTITIDLGFLDSQTQTGNGILATVTFVTAEVPNSIAPYPITLSEVLILDASHQSLGYDALNAMLFCGFIDPPSSSSPGPIDLYTQRGGIGANTFGGEFLAGTVVMFFADVNYNGFPVQHVPVAFQILDAKNQTVAVLVGITDQNGTARTQFTIRYDPSVEGTWLAIATVDVSSTTVLDTVTFTVIFPQIVGGYTTATALKKPNATAEYLTILTALCAVMVLIRRKRFLA